MVRSAKLLVVDADQDNQSNLRDALADGPYAIVGTSEYGIEATRLASELRPDLVLLRLEEPIRLGMQTLEAVRASAPSAAVVAMSSIRDGLMPSLMLAGVRGFLPMHWTVGMLKETLESLCGRLEAEQELQPGSIPVSGTVVTVFSPKGGVGKTTLSTNLAVALRKRSRARVALVDLDMFFGDVAVMLGLEPARTFTEFILERRSAPTLHAGDFALRHDSGVDVFASPHSAVDHLEHISADELQEAIRLLAGIYDFVVVDTPGAFGPRVATALDESTIVFLVTTCDMSSIKDARMALEVLRGSGYDSDRVKIILNHATRAKGVSQQDLGRTLASQIYWTLPYDARVPMSIQHGIPVVMSNGRSPVAREVDRIAATLATNSEAASARAWLPMPFRGAVRKASN